MKRYLIAAIALVLLLSTLLFVNEANADQFRAPLPWRHHQVAPPSGIEAASASTPGDLCYLSVPPDPFSAQGLATPWQFSGNGCDETNANVSAFVNAVVLSPTGQVSVYNPLVVNAGVAPAAAPVVPVIAPGSTVGISVGSDGLYVHLVGPGAFRCSNGLPGSDFGQVAFCGTPALYQAMNAAVAAGTLTVPSLGTTTTGAACPTVNSFDIVDQDPNDNDPEAVLADPATGATAQDTAVNRALFPNAVVIPNGSDNALLADHVDPALGCSPWTAPDLADPGAMLPAEELNQFQAAANPSSPPAYVPLNDEMTLVNNTESVQKTNLYRYDVDQPPVSRSAPANEPAYCTNLANVFPDFLDANTAALQAAPSVDDTATNLFTFLAERFVSTYEEVLPTPGTVPTCDVAANIPDPVTIETMVTSAQAVEP